MLDALAADVTVHPLYLGEPQAIPWLAQQQRLTFSRAGLGDPLSIAHYRSHQGFAGLQRALTLSPQEIVTELTESGLRGRGGAAFPAGCRGSDFMWMVSVLPINVRHWVSSSFCLAVSRFRSKPVQPDS